MELIEAKGSGVLSRMTEGRAKTFRLMVYAGLRFYYDDYTLVMISEETGYTAGGISKLLDKWKKALAEGSVAANAIETAYAKQRKRPAREVKPRKHRGQNEAAQAVELGKIRKSNKGHYSLGFRFSAEDEKSMRAAIRKSIVYFTTYGKGRTPRKNGAYYSPDDRPSETAKTVWIIHDQAVSYCGCTEEMLTAAAERGEIERRIYTRSGNHVYYEYSCADLDKFIEANNLV